MIIITSICVGIYNIISPQFHGIEKYSKMIGMLVVVCVMISPLKMLLNSFDKNGFENIQNSILGSEQTNKEEYDEIFNDYLNRFSIDEIKQEIKKILYENYEIPAQECEISVFTKFDEKLQLSSIQILLSGKSIFKNPYVIEEHFKELLGCTCQVLIK
jgi:hypothetical protein